MFADTSLAARIERAESRLSAAIGASVVSRGRTAGSFVEPISGGVAVWTGAGSPVNKVIGVGFADAPDPAQLEALESLFAARGSSVQVEVATLADPAWHAAFAPRGYAIAGFENVLGLPLTDPDDRDDRRGTHITVAECVASEAGAWLDVVAGGFAHPDEVPAQAAGQEYPREAIERVYEDFAAVPGFRRYLARVDGMAAGGAGVREFEGVAQLCGAATLPAFRRQGVQTALLHARLRDARRRGCDLAVITTAPGSKSQQNAQRQGFSLLYARALHVKP